jgi:hypothetical protein
VAIKNGRKGEKKKKAKQHTKGTGHHKLNTHIRFCKQALLNSVIVVFKENLLLGSTTGVV